ncbi:SRPBCC family protein [Streptomyces sp. RGM 3693]|uniref:SRPBCC family protein n=1 Tax=Streptomyces sp. RGM 3693 TaxID=3413284 RepID=UPI003D26E6B7
MPEIHAVTQLAGRSADEAWAIVKDARTFALDADHVVAIRELPSTNERHRSSEWTVLLNGSEVTWVQDEAAGPGLQLRFTQTAGDLEELTGEWRVEQTPAGARISLALAFELGIDGLAPLLDPIWAQSFHAHADALLRAVAAQAPADGK